MYLAKLIDLTGFGVQLIEDKIWSILSILNERSLEVSVSGNTRIKFTKCNDFTNLFFLDISKTL